MTVQDTLLTGRRFTDPLRAIVTVEVGGGCDTLTLECGHRVVRDHKAKHPKRTRCHGCRS
jgi:hypothetical protein